MMQDKQAKIYVAGHTGLVGSAIVRQLTDLGYKNLILRSHKQLDLKRQDQVELFFSHNRPEYVFLAAAKVGGIYANSNYPAEFIYDNLMIQSNIINAAKELEVKKLLFLGSSCIYPKVCRQPMQEEDLLTGLLEPTNEPYAIAKIAGIKLCQSYKEQYGCNFSSVMPTNLYGPFDNFDLQNSHVLPALIRKVHQAKQDNAKQVVVWGSGRPLREFLYVDDMANACIFAMQQQELPDVLNIGSGHECTIYDLAKLVCQQVGFKGEIVLDASNPDGTMRKLLDSSKILSMGWRPQVSLSNGILQTYQFYLQSLKNKYTQIA